ncbi:MAG: CotH kinase family protein, partial [Mameliella sp.]|nr:CotH kinase family protein [Phaeodactylibacter sp.]
MIIKDQEKKQRRNAGRLLLAVLGGALLLILTISLWPAPSPYDSLPKDQVYCGAEKVRRGAFVHDGLLFKGGETQSERYARHGRYSSYLPQASEPQYGLEYQLDKPKPGTAYRASVWRKQTGQQQSYLAVSVEGPKKRYHQENVAVASDSMGWEKLELHFSVPFGAPADLFKVYVYNTGQEEVWFDDFLLEPLPNHSAFIPEVVQLEIKPRHLRALEAKRAEALQSGILETNEADWVPATFKGTAHSEPIPVELRLKGDWLDHLSGNKWSFRVKIKGGEAWRRLRVFSLHTPRARHFLHEWLLHQFWEQEDVLTTRYDFIELQLNGQSLGVYAYEEHFEKQLVESRRRREGPIMKFSEDGYWKTIKRQLQSQGYVKPYARYGAGEMDSAPIEAFDDQPTEENPALAAQISAAHQLMQQYRDGLQPASRIFDLERMAKYLAFCDVLNGYHGLTWHNQRFYFNPITGKLEPIGFDGFGGPPANQYEVIGSGALNPLADKHHPLIGSLFLEEAFVRYYHKALYEYSSRDYLLTKLDSLAPDWYARLEFIQREFPEYNPRIDD